MMGCRGPAIASIMSRVGGRAGGVGAAAARPTAYVMSSTNPQELSYDENFVELEGVILHRSRCSKKNLPTSIIFLELIACGKLLGEVK